MIKVSIIVPVYNSEKYIATCLNSLLNQTLSDIQIVIVNDGSTDESEKKIEAYIKIYDDKIVYIKKENGGTGTARNTGIEYATGEYIGFVDSDDYVDMTLYEKMYREAKDINADWVECDYYHEYSDKMNKLKIKKAEYTTDDILIKTKTSVCNKIIKRKIICDNKLTFPVKLNYEDLEFVYKTVPYIHTIGYVKEALYYYIQRNGSRFHTWNEGMRDIFTVYENIFLFYTKNGFYEKYKEQIEYSYISSILTGIFNIAKIRDKKTRNILLKENWEHLITQFPLWRKNTILKNNKSLKGMYLRTNNKCTYRIYAKLFYIYAKYFYWTL
jgi:glycosyltransferase involved in cell wall biosynthesis